MGHPPDLANDVETNAGGRYAGPDSGDVATLLRWLAEGHFTLLGYQRCPVRDGRVSGEERPPASVCCAGARVLVLA